MRKVREMSEMSQKKKIIIAVSAGVLLCGLILWLILREGPKIVSQEGAPYVCTYQQKGKKLKLTVKGSIPENTEWQPEDGWETVLTMTEKKQKSRGYTMVLKKTGEVGSQRLRLNLCTKDDSHTVLQVLNWYFLVKTDGTLAVGEVVSEEIPAPQSFGSDTTYPGEVIRMADGVAELRLACGEQESWRFLPLDDAFVVTEEERTEAGEQRFMLVSAMSEALCPLVFLNESAGTVLKLSVSLDENLGVIVGESALLPLVGEEVAKTLLENDGFSWDLLQLYEKTTELQAWVTAYGTEGVVNALWQQRLYADNFRKAEALTTAEYTLNFAETVTDTVEAYEPDEQEEQTEAAEATEAIETTEAAEATEAMEPTEAAEVTEAAEATETAETAGAAEATEVTETMEEAETTEAETSGEAAEEST